MKNQQNEKSKMGIQHVGYRFPTVNMMMIIGVE